MTSLYSEGPDDHSLNIFDDVGPFRGRKRSLHEGGIRQTIAVHWPAGIAPGSVSTHLFSFIDFLPTALDLAGVVPASWPESDGISALPTLLMAGRVGAASPPRGPAPATTTTTTTTPATLAQQTHRFLYYEFCYYGNASGLLPQLYPAGWAQAVRFDDPDDGTEWKGIRVDRQQMLLFNLSGDVSESVDIAAAHQAVVATIADIMEHEHAESPQWPSTRSPAEQCCGSCYSAHGCIGTKIGQNCPAPNKTAAAAAGMPGGAQPRAPVLTVADLVGEYGGSSDRSGRSVSLVADGAGANDPVRVRVRVRVRATRGPPQGPGQEQEQTPPLLLECPHAPLKQASNDTSSGVHLFRCTSVQPAGNSDAVRAASLLSIQVVVRRVITTVDEDYRFVSWSATAAMQGAGGEVWRKAEHLLSRSGRQRWLWYENAAR